MDNLEELVFQALGQASMCWSETPKGLFDSEMAIKIGRRLIFAIEEYKSKSVRDAHDVWVVGHIPGSENTV